MDNKLYNTIQELGRSIQSAQEDAKRQCTSSNVNAQNAFQSALNYTMQQYVHNMHTYLNIDRVLGFPIQPMGYSSESEVSDRGVKIRVALHHYPSVKPMIIEAPEMVLELRATVDTNGRMEYQFSNYFANPTDLKALAPHLPEGACLILLEDGSLSVESLDESGMESSSGSASNYSKLNQEDEVGGFDGMDYANNTASLTGTLVGGAQFTVGAVKNQSLWNVSHKVHGALKSIGVKVQTRAIKHGAKTVLANASKKIVVVGGVLAVTDVFMDGQVNASHLLNIGMVGVSAIPVVGWIAGGTYFIADMITIGVSGESIGQHLDNYVGEPLYDF